MAEIELSVFGRTIKNYTPAEQAFCREAQSLVTERNQANTKIDLHGQRFSVVNKQIPTSGS